ncbi:ribosome-associated translation inhibitor RaiA [Azoarcus sp. TTM-91]|jgi:putative sigma-54 modulation protein|uniref:Ribosome hibernation promoting factor n=1 Tax=Azoarcus indigens TaxID=29545 RepID=A0A4V3BLP1_9RHOO|nr:MULTISPECIES: ribosome-associated translation inhibitor RaiA [Azoarcus]NMG34656.1 ribosome-associated translation inhibitor RaiA [Azoarcus sp. TTM-91]NMG66479.1 ribosome-associated translation inhibitor RaiA [Azoarcus indigens]TDN47352.1 putative sigma-54 modulation protein [Azoarcus indigens]
MNLNITGHHVEVTQSIREYVTTKLDKVIRHFDNVTSVSVILSVEKLKQKAEVTVHVRGKDLFVESEESDLYAAIDGMIDKLDRQILKHKQKSADHDREALKHQSPEA